MKLYELATVLIIVFSALLAVAGVNNVVNPPTPVAAEISGNGS